MNNVTLIDELDSLPELSAMDGSYNHGDDVNYEKYIRNHHVVPNEAGMTMHAQEAPPVQQYMEEVHAEPAEVILPTSARLHCIDVHAHIESCPICKKFYKNDNSIYIATIIILLLICIILLKKVLNV